MASRCSDVRSDGRRCLSGRDLPYAFSAQSRRRTRNGRGNPRAEVGISFSRGSPFPMAAFHTARKGVTLLHYVSYLEGSLGLGGVRTLSIEAACSHSFMVHSVPRTGSSHTTRAQPPLKRRLPGQFGR